MIFDKAAPATVISQSHEYCPDSLDDTPVKAFCAYSIKALPGMVNPAVAQRVMASFVKHVEKEVDLSLEYDFRLNRDLLLINDTEEEGLLFEIPDKTNIEADAKEEVLKSWKDQEISLLKQLTM